MSSARELIDDSIKLFSLPATYFEIRNKLQNPEVSTVEIGDLIQRDPGLTVRLLRLVNSAWFGRAVSIETVQLAAVALGREQLHNLILSTALTQCLGNKQLRLLDMESYWQRSVQCAVLARRLARQCGLVESERLFVAGLLHEVGHLVMYERIPEQTEGAVIRAQVEERPIWKVERDELGFDYAEVGAELLSAWQLSEALEQAVRFHPVPEQADSFKLDACIVHLARELTHGSGVNLELSSAQALEITSLTADQVEDVSEAAAAELPEVEGILSAAA